MNLIWKQICSPHMLITPDNAHRYDVLDVMSKFGVFNLNIISNRQFKDGTREYMVYLYAPDASSSEWITLVRIRGHLIDAIEAAEKFLFQNNFGPVQYNLPAECVSIPEKKSHPNVCSHVVHTPQAYLEKVTGKFFFLKTNNPVEEIEEILEEYCPDESLWNYPLEEINHIVENDLRVVLVDVSTICEGMVHTPAYRWFEVPEGFSEAAGDKEVSV